MIQLNSTQPNPTQHNITQHNTTQHNITQHNTTQHNTTQPRRPSVTALILSSHAIIAPNTRDHCSPQVHGVCRDSRARVRGNRGEDRRWRRERPAFPPRGKACGRRDKPRWAIEASRVCQRKLHDIVPQRSRHHVFFAVRRGHDEPHYLYFCTIFLRAALSLFLYHFLRAALSLFLYHSFTSRTIFIFVPFFCEPHYLYFCTFCVPGPLQMVYLLVCIDSLIIKSTCTLLK